MTFHRFWLVLLAWCLVKISICSAQECEDGCACDNERAQDCGATNTDRPQACCEGYVCAGRGSVRCVPESSKAVEEGDAPVDEAVEETPDEEPAADKEVPAEEELELEEEVVEEEEPAMEEEQPAEEEDPNCAKAGERSQQCGATNSARPATCCSGLTCAGGASVICIEDPALSTPGSGSGIYQTERYQLGEIQVEGTSFESETDSRTIRINLPEEATARAFVMMFIGDSGGTNGERAAYHDNWVHLVDVGENESEDLNVKVQHKVWAGNNDSFRVWDGINKFVIMPSMLGVDEENPIVEYAAERFTDLEAVVAPSVNSVDGGTVVVMYLLDAASADDTIISGVINDGFQVLSSDLAKSGESMAAFAAASPEGGGCTGPIAATSTGEFSSGIAITVSLRPLLGAVEELDDCTDFVVATTDVPTVTPITSSPTADSTANSTADSVTMKPTDIPTSPSASLPWFEPTQEPTLAVEEAEEAEEVVMEPTPGPTVMDEIVPPTEPPSSSLMATTTIVGGIMLIGTLLVLSL